MYVPYPLAELLVFGSAVIVPIMMLVCLVDIVRRPTTVWESSSQNQLLWALIAVFVAFFGPILYFVLAVPKLNAATVRHESIVGDVNVSH